MTSFEDWQRGGARNHFPFASGETFSIWSRVDPKGSADVPHATLLHGFPTHSLDWARIVRGLDGRVRSLSFDLLGFGSSDKPAGRPYSLMEQADLTEAIWAHHGIERTLLVAHDYSVSIAQELLARRAEGRLAVALTGVVFLNGGLWPDLHRAMPAQIALLDPERGPKVSAAVNEELFTRGLGATFSPEHQPSKAEAHETWLGVALRDGHRRGHELIHYIHDRRRLESRWVGALEATDLPKRFVWGVLDPVSGGHVLPRILERFPHDPVTPLPAVGHWPSLEAPDVVVAAILEAVGAA
jgi:pimeloyl-ACP methyl ester carboxylesterase